MAAAFFAKGAFVSMRRNLLIGLLLACLAAAAAWFISNFERRTESELVGFQGKARRDPWLAAERLLQRMGMNATAVRSLPELDSLPQSATLVLPKGRQSLSAQSRRSLLNWVSKGGRLIVEAEPAYQPDPLLDALGVRRKAAKETENRKHDDGDDTGRELVEIALPPELAPVNVLMKRNFDLQANGALARFGGREATAVLLLQHGRGNVLVLNELDAFSNQLIGTHDHAEFLWRIVQVDQGAPAVLFFSDPKKLSLLGWLRTNAWSAVAGVLLFLLLWLWSAAPRLGPIAPDPVRARRRLLDHLRASGRFLWAHGGSQLLVDAAREACLRRIARVHPDLIAAPGTEHEAEREARLAELIGLDAEQSRMLFSQKAPTRMIEFLHTIRLYQTVHERLALRRPAAKNTKGMR
ncbi:MAG: DUF4350 domain-containing protein [Betaproteobacteria bacterium]|nr:DUF4350 domain-containing protein [Betaproteobacteria bacterium]